MNSMGVSPYVHYIYNDLTDGNIIFQLYDICKPGCVDWNKVRRTFSKLKAKFEKIGPFKLNFWYGSAPNVLHLIHLDLKKCI